MYFYNIHILVHFQAKGMIVVYSTEYFLSTLVYCTVEDFGTLLILNVLARKNLF